MLSTIFMLEGQVPAKKNSRRLFYKNGRMINIPSEKYQEWHDNSRKQLEGFGKLKPPYDLTCTFWVKDKRPRDLDNMIASVCDLLQDVEIIENDDAKLLTHIEAYYGGVDKDCPRVKIELHSQN